ncbi:hypothetical protein CGRA01v4_02308 [Colletotrichum graminicola]|nr:hypothetical protein CGRA01v4_02308 [Colletotrichum graminicola]
MAEPILKRENKISINAQFRIAHYPYWREGLLSENTSLVSWYIRITKPSPILYTFLICLSDVTFVYLSVSAFRMLSGNIKYTPRIS